MKKQKPFFILYFFVNWGYMCGCQTKKTWLVSKPPCNASLENQGAAGMPEKQAKPENSNEKT